MFSQHWFEDLNGRKNFNCLKNLFNTNKSINFLEIGCFEGNCHLWMYKNLLLNKFSKSTVIDPFGGGTGNSMHNDVYAIFWTVPSFPTVFTPPSGLHQRAGHVCSI